MPVAVIALAAGSFAAAATTFAAATTIAGMVAAGATMVGSALTIVGTVTGNQKLTKIGAIVGIAGGIGSLMNSAASGAEAAAAAAGDTAGSTAAGAAADAAGSAGAAAGDALTTLPVAAPGGIEAMGSSAGSTGTGMLDAVSSSTGGAAAPGGMMNAAGSGSANTLTQAIADPTSTFNAGQTATGQAVGNAFDASATTTGQAGMIDAFKAPTPFQQLGMQNSGNGMLASIESPAMGGTASTFGNQVAAGSGGFSGALDSVQSWAKANPELAKMALSGVGTVAGNLVPSAKDKAMMDAYKAQAASNTAQTAALNRKALWGSGRV